MRVLYYVAPSNFYYYLICDSLTKSPAKKRSPHTHGRHNQSEVTTFQVSQISHLCGAILFQKHVTGPSGTAEFQGSMLVERTLNANLRRPRWGVILKEIYEENIAANARGIISQIMIAREEVASLGDAFDYRRLQEDGISIWQ